MDARRLVDRHGLTTLLLLGALGASGCIGDLGGDSTAPATGSETPQDPDSPVLPHAPFTSGAGGASAPEAPGGGGAGGMEAAVGPTYAAGTELVTTGSLNLRAGEGTSFDVITVMPVGSHVTVVEASGSNGWVHIQYQAETGYGWYEYLAPPPPPVDQSYDPSRAATLAAEAIALWTGHSAGGYCLKGVRISCQNSGILPTPPGWHYEGSAIDWGNWANANPSELAATGFKRVSVGVNEVPQGAIIVWQPGQCGYSAQYGHVEIVVDTNSSKACSDFCGNVKKTCGDPWVYIPTKL